MAEEEQSQEKTEQPSEKRLKELREKGQVARSKDFNATVILLFSGLGFLIFGGHLSRQMGQMMRQSFEFNRAMLYTPAIALEHFSSQITDSLGALTPILMIILLLSLLAPLILGGWVFSGQVLQPKFSRLNPLSGLKRMVSLKGLVEMIKSFLKFIVVAVMAVLVIKAQIPELLALADASIETAIQSGAYILVKSFLMISSSLILIAALDVPFQLYEHHKASRMTKQELKDEYKESEGKPEVKSAIRRAQQEMARRRMMSAVPKANVILTNPTHYAVAISYKEKGNRAPIVVAKGKDLIAFQISKVAKESQVPIICIPPLARAIYFSTKLNAEVPRGLYVAVAQVLAYIFHLRDKQHYDHKPSALQDLPIPEELAKKAEEESE